MYRNIFYPMYYRITRFGVLDLQFLYISLYSNTTTRSGAAPSNCDYKCHDNWIFVMEMPWIHITLSLQIHLAPVTYPWHRKSSNMVISNFMIMEGDFFLPCAHDLMITYIMGLRLVKYISRDFRTNLNTTNTSNIVIT